MNEQIHSIVHSLIKQYVIKRHEWLRADYDRSILVGKYVNGLEFTMRQIPELLVVAEGVYLMTRDPSLESTSEVDQSPTYDLDSEAFNDMVTTAVSYGVATLDTRWKISAVSLLQEKWE